LFEENMSHAKPRRSEGTKQTKAASGWSGYSVSGREAEEGRNSFAFSLILICPFFSSQLRVTQKKAIISSMAGFVRQIGASGFTGRTGGDPGGGEVGLWLLCPGMSSKNEKPFGGADRSAFEEERVFAFD
jgi:hypothetical protein